MIRLFGICHRPLGMVMEFAGAGDLYHFLDNQQKGLVRVTYSPAVHRYPLPEGAQVLDHLQKGTQAPHDTRHTAHSFIADE